MRANSLKPRWLASSGIRRAPGAVTLLGEEPDLLTGEGYSLQSLRKTREGAQHPDRDAQFQFLNTQVQAAIKAGQPVVSVDTKKKELVGDFKNAGQEWQKKKTPIKVRVHDFIDPALGKAAPCGVYDLAANRSGAAPELHSADRKRHAPACPRSRY